MSQAHQLKHPPAPPLPESTEKMVALRALKTQRTLNDLVEDVHVLLWEDERYSNFLHAVWDEQAIEGSLAADNIMAADMIRAKAKVLGQNELASQKLATIAKALGIVLRRYNLSRKIRRNTVRGEVVPSEQNNGD